MISFWLLASGVSDSNTAAAQGASAKNFKTFTLTNGARLVLSPDRRIPRVVVYVRHRAGAAQEGPGK